MLDIEFVSNIANNFFEHIFKSHNPREGLFFIKHHR